jgi:hypothetical protein
VVVELVVEGFLQVVDDGFKHAKVDELGSVDLVRQHEDRLIGVVDQVVEVLVQLGLDDGDLQHGVDKLVSLTKLQVVSEEINVGGFVDDVVLGEPVVVVVRYTQVDHPVVGDDVDKLVDSFSDQVVQVDLA